MSSASPGAQGGLAARRNSELILPPRALSGTPWNTLLMPFNCRF